MMSDGADQPVRCRRADGPGFSPFTAICRAVGRATTVTI